MAINGIAGRERERNLNTTVKAKLVQLRSARLTRQDQAVGLLDMQMLQMVKTHKPRTTSIITFNQVLAILKYLTS
jgi:predicted dienelactone hydrolase